MVTVFRQSLSTKVAHKSQSKYYYKPLHYYQNFVNHILSLPVRGAGIKKQPIKSSHKICSVSEKFSFGASIEKIMFVKMKFCGSKMNSVRTIIFSLLEGFSCLLNNND